MKHGVLICTFLAFVFYSSLIPSLPELLGVKELGATFYGTIQSISNFMAMLAATWVGALSDRYGKRSAIVGCFGMGCIGTALLGSRSMHWALPVLGLTLRRIDSSSSRGVIKAYVVGQHPGVGEKALQEQQAASGRMMMMMGLGFSAGSSLGGWLSGYGTPTVAAIALVGGATATGIAALVLEEVGKPGEQAQGREQHPPRHEGFKWYTERGVVALLLVRLLMGMAFFFITSTFDLYCRERFEFSPAQFGYLLSYIGLCFSLVSGVLVPEAVKHFRPRPLFLGSMLLLALARVGLAVASTVPHVLLADLLVAIGSSLTGAVGITLLAETSEANSGFLMGLSESAQSLAGVATPALAGFLYEHYGNSAPGWISALCCLAAALVYVIVAPNDTPKRASLESNKKSI